MPADRPVLRTKSLFPPLKQTPAAGCPHRIGAFEANRPATHLALLHRFGKVRSHLDEVPAGNSRERAIGTVVPVHFPPGVSNRDNQLALSGTNADQIRFAYRRAPGFASEIRVAVKLPDVIMLGK